MAKRKPVDDVTHLTQRGAAALLGITPRALRLRRDIPRSSDGSYDGRRLVAFVEKRAAGRDAGAGDVDTLGHWRKEKLRAEAEREALALAREREEVVDRRRYEEDIARLAAAFSGALNTVSALAVEVAGKTPAECKAILTEWADELRRETFKTDGNDHE